MLKKVRGLDLRGDNISVFSPYSPWKIFSDMVKIQQNILFHFLDDLDAYLDKLKSQDRNEDIISHLSLLLDFMEKIYASTKRHLNDLLSHQEITYNLLWAIFPPNTLVNTTCPGTKKPQCVRYDFGQEKRLPDGSCYFSLSCRYFDFDGQNLGDVSMELAIYKFRGAERIENLPNFPLQYHSARSEITARLRKCGQKFASLCGTHHQHCRGAAFFMQDNKPIQVSVDGRIMVDAMFFREINPNYTRPHGIETRKPESSLLDMRKKESTLSTVTVTSIPRKASELKEEELLICCPTVPGFSFGDKLWRESLLSRREMKSH